MCVVSRLCFPKAWGSTPDWGLSMADPIPSWSATKGHVSAECLWTACRALTAGFLLIAIGAAMATLGFYAEQWSSTRDALSNGTVLVLSGSRDFPLTNLTYVGPVVMGVGGFVIVATCVMTFEARDSAAKVAPIRLRKPEVHVTVEGVETGVDRGAITSALVQFSVRLQSSMESAEWTDLGAPNPLRKCPSAPSLVPPYPASPKLTSTTYTTPEPHLLSVPGQHRILLARQAASVDTPLPPNSAPLFKTESDTSMAMDLHFPHCAAITLRVHDESRLPGAPPTPKPSRVGSTRRPPLLRQVPVDCDDPEC